MAARAPHGSNQPPKIVIVKKIIADGHGGHHGGAWKVAYADFVTAMMAFFLLLWLLGATNEKQRKGCDQLFCVFLHLLSDAPFLWNFPQEAAEYLKHTISHPGTQPLNREISV